MNCHENPYHFALPVYLVTGWVSQCATCADGSHAYAQRSYTNGENIAGVLNLDMISDQVSSETPLSFDYTFAAAGTYTVTVSVWNCDVGTAVTDAIAVTILPTSEWWWVYLPMVVRP